MSLLEDGRIEYFLSASVNCHQSMTRVVPLPRLIASENQRRVGEGEAVATSTAGGGGRGGLLIYCAEASKIVPSKLIIRLDQTGDFNFQCSLCGILFKRRKQAQEHSYKHSDKFPYECHFCNYGTVRSYNLKRHCERLHSTPKASHQTDLRSCNSLPSAPDATNTSSQLSPVVPTSPQHPHQAQSTIDSLKLIRSGAVDSTEKEELKEQEQISSTVKSENANNTFVTKPDTSENPPNPLRGGSLSSGKTTLSGSSINKSDVAGEDQGNDSDCLMIEESVSDVEDMQ